MLITMEYYHILAYFFILFMIYFYRDGCTSSGLCVVTSLVIEQKELDEEVDIFQVVRRIQTRRPELLSSVVSFIYLDRYKGL